MAKEKYYGFSDSKSKAEVPTKEDIATAEVDSDEKVYSAKYFNKKIGKLSDLIPSVKTSVVAAINKVWDTLEERTGKELRLYVNDDGGAIAFTEKETGRIWRANLYKDTFRIYTDVSDGKYCIYTFPFANSGGTIGTVEQINAVKKLLEERTNGKVKIYSDAEGGNIRITSPNGINWEIDAYKDYIRIYGISKDGKYCGYAFPMDTANGGGTVGTKEQIESVNSLATTLRENLKIKSAAVGSAYGISCSYQANAYFTTVTFNGTNVGDKLAPYTQRNFGTLPSGYRPAVKCQHPVSAIDGLYFTVDTNGQCSMRNEKSTEISFGKAAMHGVITFAH